MNQEDFDRVTGVLFRIQDEKAAIAAELEATKSRLAECEEVVRFYAELNSWQLRTLNESGVGHGWAMRISKSDCEFVNKPARYFGGKRARTYLGKYKKRRMRDPRITMPKSV